jgi:hypothetical protein
MWQEDDFEGYSTVFDKREVLQDLLTEIQNLKEDK